MDKILLTGYMASGKTTIANLLAKASGIPYLDLDEMIERKTAKTIPQIFAEDGEIKFRMMEHSILKELLDEEKTFILALGGGTPCYANNHEFLKRDDVISIYLKTGIEELAGRIVTSEKSRPLIYAVEDDLKEFIAKHLFDRSYYYMQSKHIVSTDGKTPEAIVNEIMSLI